ncbi:MAG: Gfo/Idh/MocA family oxidoreductase [Proteobacteria bacterium]|nr:Gfo/Idh/MocA family oxidoreductase [Pseudomonadota bacterium]
MTLRVGLVGIGDAGAHHGRALAAMVTAGANDAELSWTAICGRDATRIAAFRDAVSAPASAATYLGLDALIAARACDAVILATPDALHADQVIAAAAAGLHVLVEKPLASRVVDAERAIAAARAANVALRVGYHLRHHAGHRVVRDRLPELGRIRHVDVRWAWPDPAVDGWRARGEGDGFWSLAALGTHAIDLVLWLAGDVTDVRGLVDGRPDRAAEVVLRLASGGLAHVTTSVVHRAISRLSIVGERGELECLGTLGARGAGTITHRAGVELHPVAFDVGDPYLAQLRDFAAATAHGFVDDPALVANVRVLEALRQ